jgi:hypothetical protein
MRLDRAKMIRKSFYFEVPTLEKLEKLAMEYGCSVSQLMRDFLRDRTNDEDLKVSRKEHLRLNEVRKKNEIQRSENRFNPHVMG